MLGACAIRCRVAGARCVGRADAVFSLPLADSAASFSALLAFSFAVSASLDRVPSAPALASAPAAVSPTDAGLARGSGSGSGPSLILLLARASAASDSAGPSSHSIRVDMSELSSWTARR